MSTFIKKALNSKLGTVHLAARTFLVLILPIFLVSVSFGFASKREEKLMQSNTTERSSVGDSSVWITRSDGAKQCMPGSGVTLVQGSAELQASHISVLDSKKGTDGKMHAQVCGSSRGSTNNYLIGRDKLDQALALGYSEVVSSR